MIIAKQIATYGDNDEVVVGRLNEDESILVVTINTPDELNVMSVEMMAALAGAFDAITQMATPDPNLDSVRAVILRAEGISFAVGLDIASLAGDYINEGVPRKGDPWFAMWDCPFPILGAVNGAAVTGGFEVALCCDFLLASKEAVFMDNHPKYGVHPGRRISQRLAEICGANNAKLATMSSYPIDAQMALTWGLVSQVLPGRQELDVRAVEVARMVAGNHPVMVKRYKKLIDEGGMGTYREGLKLEDASEKTFYSSLTDVDTTLRDGAEKFQKMLKWVRDRENS